AASSQQHGKRENKYQHQSKPFVAFSHLFLPPFFLSIMYKKNLVKKFSYQRQRVIPMVPLSLAAKEMIVCDIDCTIRKKNFTIGVRIRSFDVVFGSVYIVFTIIIFAPEIRLQLWSLFM